MKTIYQLIPESVISALGWTLVHSVWQGMLLAIFAFAGFFILSKKSAAARYNFGIVLLGLQVISSAATYLYYYLTTPVRSYQPITTSLSAVTRNWQTVNYDLSLTAKVQIWLNSHLFELVVCWIIGTGLLMLRFAGAWIYTEHLRSKASFVTDQEWRTRFGTLTAKMNISQSIEFRQTAKILTPMVIGAFRPAVLIPIGLLTGFSTSQIEAILAHELAHVRRNDYLVNLLQSFVEVVFFFHPALWWISERVRTEREHCCDDIALTICGDKMVLANALVKVAEWQSAPELAMAFASKKPLLLNRIRRVLGVTSKSSRPFGNIPAMFLAICLIAGISFYSVAQQEKKEDKKVVKTKEISRREDFQKLQKINIDTVIRSDVSKDSSVTIEVNNQSNNIGSILGALQNVNINQEISNFSSLNSQLAMLGNVNQERSEELEKLQRRMDELNLLSEKENFEMERFQRKMEKLDWKKDRLMESRSKLIEKRASVFNSPRNGQQNSKNSAPVLSESELEKQLEDFEQQIKAQEQQISEFNSQIASARKEIEDYRESEEVKNNRKEMEDLNRKIEAIHKERTISTYNYQTEGPVIIEPGKPPRITGLSKVKIKGKGTINPPAAPKAPAEPPTLKLSAPKAPPAPPVEKK
ncbi:M56 family metallopeptidase [Dyadobacter psychrotolerans]|uniref:Peptidase M56 domain-containing protein n=1 Tax=Dyadobacter psychrotolerans TaxID=2541721 RepID=A0A4R5DID3_9BACT|nr:M56 family metallopeptidase [Dyadobacter psychrotolerans]TDE13872.1 hypothetical protein E0F88_18470 [Dyadobacter psychrotolerans]